MWSPSWKRRSVSNLRDCSCNYSSIIHTWLKKTQEKKKIFFVVAVDPEFNMHRVWRPQTSGVMAEKWSRS